VHGQCRVVGSLPLGPVEYRATTSYADAKTPGGCSDLVRLVRLNLIMFLSINLYSQYVSVYLPTSFVYAGPEVHISVSLQKQNIEPCIV